MAVLKCKMCGGSLDVVGDSAVCTCEYCGTSQTVPKASNDENVADLFNRANDFRNACDFERAERIYERIIENDPTEAEAYWGLILCKYGIEYVKDPRTENRIPTCHRASYDAIIVDSNYKNALKFANVVQKPIYEKEARQIDTIQKGILTLARDEEPYDVFICYKETGADGKRTKDSVLANDIYYQLTEQGYKVFYSAITLEDKLGTAYEPYIFAALNSAKVMLVIGTKPEYFKAVWVKNEWSRYLQIIKNDMKKVLIPCYRDMDAYDLPEEFAHIQALDMSKIGFINDVERACVRVCGKKKKEEEAPQPTYQPQSSGTGVNVQNLIRRMYDALEENEITEADKFAEKIIDEDCTCIEPYIVKLLIENNVRRAEDLCTKKVNKDTRTYRSFLKYATPDKKEEIEGYIEKYKENTYSRGLRLFNEGQYNEAIEEFDEVIGYKDAREQIKKCNIEKLKLSAKADKEKVEKEYNQAVNLFNEGKVTQALSSFTELDIRCDYLDFATTRYEKDDYKEVFEEFYTFESEDGKYYKDTLKYIERCKEIQKEEKYKNAINLYNQGEFEEAIKIFKALGNYKDSQKYIEQAGQDIEVANKERKYEDAINLYSSGKFYDAMLKFEALSGYSDSEQYIDKCKEGLKASESELIETMYLKLKNGSYQEAKRCARELAVYDLENPHVYVVEFLGTYCIPSLKDIKKLKGTYKNSVEYQNLMIYAGDAVKEAECQALKEKLVKIISLVVLSIATIYTFISSYYVFLFDFGASFIDINRNTGLTTKLISGIVGGIIIIVCAYKKGKRSWCVVGFVASMCAGIAGGIYTVVAVVVSFLALLFVQGKIAKIIIYVIGGIMTALNIVDLTRFVMMVYADLYIFYILDFILPSIIVAVVLGAAVVTCCLIKGRKVMAIDGALACIYPAITGGWAYSVAIAIIFILVAFLTNKEETLVPKI